VKTEEHRRVAATLPEGVFNAQGRFSLSPAPPEIMAELERLHLPIGGVRTRLHDTPRFVMERLMNRPYFSFLPLIFMTFVLCLVTEPAATQEVGLVTVDVKDVAKGYRANSLRLKPVLNDKKELIGTIDDFMFGRDDGVFVILAVGDFVGLSGHLVAVPFKSLKLDDPSGSIVLPGASQAALLKLPVFFYNR
jgi:hypothetical protein